MTEHDTGVPGFGGEASEVPYVAAPARPVEPHEEPVEQLSILDQLREKKLAASKEMTFDLPIAGWNGDVIARYRTLDPTVEGAQIAQRVRKQYPNDTDVQEFWALVDSMIAACEGLYGVDDADGELKPLSANGGPPVTYSRDLSEALDLGTKTARETVIAIFKGNKAAVRAHGLKLQMRMADPEGTLRLGEI